MKRLSLVLAMFLFVAFSIKAQEQSEVSNTANTNSEVTKAKKASNKTFHFGLKASPAISWLKSNKKYMEQDGMKMNINGGLILDFNFTENYAFSTGFEIASFGGKLSYPASEQDSVYYLPEESRHNLLLTTRTHKFRYINVPLTLKLKTNQIGSMVYFGQFGFDLGLRWRALADDEGKQKGIATQNKAIDIQKEVSFLRLALNVGLGVEYNLAGNTSILIAANYNNGFTNAFRKESYNLIDKEGSKLKQDAFANFISLSLGVLF